jgi:hypothetical protein
VQLPNYHCFCKTFLWWKHAVDRSTDPWLLNGKVVFSSRSLFHSAANCTWLPLGISKVPVFLCHLVFAHSLFAVCLCVVVSLEIWVVTLLCVRTSLNILIMVTYVHTVSVRFLKTMLTL